MFIILFTIISIFALFDSYVHKNIFIYVGLVLMILVAGLRSIYSGADTIRYYYDYSNISEGFAPLNSHEHGFILLEKIFTALHLPIWCFFFFIAFTTILILAVSYYKFLFPTTIGFAILYYYSRFFIGRDLNQVRSSLAAAIILLSLLFVARKKILPFILMILIASSIHSAAIIALLIYPIYIFWGHLSDKRKVYSYLFILIVSAILSYVIAPYISNINSGRLDAYTQSTFYTSTVKGLFNPVIWLQVIISLLALYKYILQKKECNRYFEAALVVYMISTVLLILLSQYYTLAGRTSTLFATVEPVLLIESIKLRSHINIYRIAMLLSSIVIFILINCSSGLITQTNYSFFFN